MSINKLSSYPIYSADTSSIINGYRDKKGNVVLEYLANNRRVKVTPGVYREIEYGRDDLYHWLERKKNLVVEELTLKSTKYIDHLIEHYSDSFTDNDNPGLTYCGLIKSETASDADPEVIALAKANGYVVLADETSGIKGACKLEGISCICLTKLIEIEFFRADKQTYMFNDDNSN